MRYISNQFRAKQDEIIRPAIKLHFEVGTDVIHSLKSVGNTLLDFDDTVAPIVAPANCTNGYHYAVLGDGVSVDDPDRICAPDNSGVFAKPNHSVPYGVTPYTASGSYALIGNDSSSSFNFTGITTGVTLNFGGGSLPEMLRVEAYDSTLGYWFIEKEYLNLTPTADWTFIPDNPDSGNVLRRFKVKNNHASGRFQLNWIRKNSNTTPVVFKNNYIASVNISEETDLTSQSLPDYEMTVSCLDVDGIYSPESEYWVNQFKDGSPCFIKAGYTINGSTEYVPLFYGKLTEKPDYEQNKITFKVAVDWRTVWSYAVTPVFDDTLSVGDNVGGNSFGSILFNSKLFDTYDYDYNESNYSGELDTRDLRQLIANAMGCFIKSGFNSVDLLDANSIQYESFVDYLTRYDQVKASLESKSKVGKISVTRYANTVSSEYVEVEALASAPVGSDEHRYANFLFEVPFFATGKYEVVDSQSSDPDANIRFFTNPETYKLDNGNYEVSMPLTADIPTTIQPIIRFYKVDNANFEETEILDNDAAGEVYSNDNQLVTSSAIASKVKQVAHLVNDISYQYEVDNVQDLRYEVGDIIRLETEKNVYKTCVITGIKHTLPGSTGHITCRRVFSFDDSDYAVLEPVGLSASFGVTTITVTEASERACFVGSMHVGATTYLYVMGVEEYDEDISGVVTNETYNATLTDLNNHVWKFAYYTVSSGTQIATNAPMIVLPEYDVSSGIGESAYGAISLLKSIYAEQGMSAPVDYTCEWEII